MATVSPLPRTNIITLASPSAGPWLVGFRLFEAAALRVYINGALTTDYTVSANFVDGYDDNATITSGTTLASSTEIQIDGFMAPQRQDDYLNGPNLVDEMNIELGRVWATLSENRMLLKRAVLGLKEIGAGDAADAGGRRIKNIAAPTETNDALRAVDVQNILVGGGNVPAPLVGQIGYLLQATGTGTFGWISRADPLGAALEAIRGLTPASDRAMYFTGTSTAALMTVTAFARTLLDDVDQAAMRATLGVPQAGAITVADLAPAAVVLGDEGIEANKNNTSFPTALAVARKTDLKWGASISLTASSGTSDSIAFAPFNIPGQKVREFKIALDRFSLNGTGDIRVRLWDSTATEIATGYNQSAALNAVLNTSTDGFYVLASLATRVISGLLEFWLVDDATNTWACRHNTAVTGGLIGSGFGLVALPSACYGWSLSTTTGAFDGTSEARVGFR